MCVMSTLNPINTTHLCAVSSGVCLCIVGPCSMFRSRCVMGSAALSLQEAEDDEEECDAGDDEELAVEDEELLAAAADLLPALAISMGPDAYAPVFLSLHAEPLIARIKPQQPIALRAIAAGAVAEVAENLGGRMAPVV